MRTDPLTLPSSRPCLPHSCPNLLSSVGSPAAPRTHVHFMPCSARHHSWGDPYLLSRLSASMRVLRWKQRMSSRFVVLLFSGTDSGSGGGSATRSTSWGAARSSSWGAARSTSWGATRLTPWGAARPTSWGATRLTPWGGGSGVKSLTPSRGSCDLRH